ncbi:hypothetical protein HKBW3S43_00845 [Candidatus Hakubella thermalkaliphila]|uniref:Uncharacterized protein n=2 Tax=Candidatus Hakubella thermalkaliphila TaxID=2754717 RepID=A0A6V8P786_9ACTN|nr:hypothetical protein [Actinomycetota bacterium]GFP28248.1 hypothetical protein HKBW3S33_01664 [Candidatus Hakubella thermalkaliphila]GFP35053.1 hypothetical protein HKBW3S43_00845 [Candidatus Hakubella thermalkaliphila]
MNGKRRACLSLIRAIESELNHLKCEHKEHKEVLSNMTKEAIPKFKSEDEEREFWSTHDATKFIDLSQAQPARFPELKPSLKIISIRLPESLLDSIKVIAHKKDVPYQSLMKMLLAEAVERELGTKF